MEDPRDHRPYARAGLDGRLGRRHLPRARTGRGDDGACRVDPTTGRLPEVRFGRPAEGLGHRRPRRPPRLRPTHPPGLAQAADGVHRRRLHHQSRGPRRTTGSPLPRQLLTTRAARWATFQVGRHARSVSEVAGELGCAWHTVNATVVAYGEALLEADVDRFGAVERPRPRRGADGAARALPDPAVLHPAGRRGPWPAPRRRPWSQLCRAHGLAGRTGPGLPGRHRLRHLGPLRPLPAGVRAHDARRPRWSPTRSTCCVTPTPSSTSAEGGSRTRPSGIAAASPTPSTGAAGCSPRRRSGSTTRDRRSWPDCSAPAIRTVTWRPSGRRRRRSASSTPTPMPTSPSSGSPSWAVTSRTPTTRSRPARSVAPSSAGGVRSPPGTRPTSRNGPTEAVNNLIKRVKRAAFGFTSFRNYRIRSLLYAGKPNWDLLATITPR